MGFFRKLFGRTSTEPSTLDPASTTTDQSAVAVASPVASEASAETPTEVVAVAATELPTEPLISAEPLAELPAAQTAGAVATERSQKTTAPLDPEQLPERDPDGTNYLGTRDISAAPIVAKAVSTRGLASWAARDIGRIRRNNQDSVYTGLMSLPDGEHDISVGLFVVADGMGGHEGGEIASRRAIETVMIAVLEQMALPAMADEDPGNPLPLLMMSAVQDANTRIWNEAQSRGTDMGTTCTAALLVGDGLYIAHVGDSRLYAMSDGKLRLITADHSTVGRLIAMGQLTEEETRNHPLRNQLYRTVGQHPEIQVDSIYQSLEGISHLLLCSDGLWSMVDDDEMAAIINETPWPQDACQRLIARANLAGGEDNISAVVVSLPPLQGQGALR